MIDETLKKYILKTFRNHTPLRDEELEAWDKNILITTGNTEYLIEIIQTIANTYDWIDDYQFNRFIVPLVKRIHDVDADNGVNKLFDCLKDNHAQSYIAGLLYLNGVKDIIDTDMDEARYLFEQGAVDSHLASITGFVRIILTSVDEDLRNLQKSNRAIKASKQKLSSIKSVSEPTEQELKNAVDLKAILENLEKAHGFLEIACKDAYPPAHFERAKLFAKDKYCDYYDSKKAIDDLSLAATKGYSNAQYAFGTASANKSRFLSVHIDYNVKVTSTRHNCIRNGQF